MHPGDCESWDYETFPNHEQLVLQRSAALLSRLKGGNLGTKQTALDTRPAHSELFVDLTPTNCRYFAGNYRGTSYRCLQFYTVGVRSDPRVGAPPASVVWEMGAFCKAVDAAVAALDAAHQLPDLAREKKLVNAVMIFARLFERFLRIHPYANGNGHAGRLMLVALLGRYGFWPQRFCIEPKPPDPPYSTAIAASRGGDHEPLERFILALM